MQNLMCNAGERGACRSKLECVLLYFGRVRRCMPTGLLSFTRKVQGYWV